MSDPAAPSPADGEAIRPSDLRKVVTEALDEAERVGMTRPVTDEWVSIKLLASPALATLRARERATALTDAATEIPAQVAIARETRNRIGEWLRDRANDEGVQQ